MNWERRMNRREKDEQGERRMDGGEKYEPGREE